MPSAPGMCDCCPASAEIIGQADMLVVHEGVCSLNGDKRCGY